MQRSSAASSNTATGNTSAGSKVIQEDTNIHSDVVEPPKFITGRHVGAIFEKLGLDPTGGMQIMAALCEAVAKWKKQHNQDSSDSEGRNSNVSATIPEEDESSDEPTGLDTRTSFSQNQPNAALAAAFGKISVTNQPNTTANTTAPAAVDTAAPSSTTSTAPGSPSRDGSGSSNGTNNYSQYKMDVNDFIRYMKYFYFLCLFLCEFINRFIFSLYFVIII